MHFVTRVVYPDRHDEIIISNNVDQAVQAHWKARERLQDTLTSCCSVFDSGRVITSLQLMLNEVKHQ